MTAKQKRALSWIAATAGILLIGVAGAYLLLVHLSLEAVQAGRTSIRLLGVEIAHPVVERVMTQLADGTEGPFPALLRSTLYSKFLLGLGLAVLVALALVFRSRTREVVVRYFTASTHPLNLALFRVAIFGFAAGMFSYEYLLLFASLPESFLVPPVGMGWLLDLVPVRPGLATWTYGIFLIATVSAAVGFMTRVAAAIALVSGTYVLGIPNFYGKVDHYNHVIWFMAILAVSPAGDTLSVDALLRSWRRKGSYEPPGAHVRYALPLRIAWILIGVCYFFPGLWKIARGGLAWPLGDTFRTILYRQWAVMPGFEAPFALDRFPILYRTAASAAVVFELTFLILIFFPLLRRFVVAAGLAFHNVTGLMMNIWFLPMQVSYSAFIDWHVVFRWIGSRVFPSEATLTYDPRNPIARSLVGATRHLDLLQRVRFVHVTTAAHHPPEGLRFASSRRAVRDWSAWLALLPRIPLAAVLLPALAAAGIPRKLASGELDALRVPSGGRAEPARRRASSLWAVATVGAGLILANGWFGAQSIEGGWPFASYPTFATIRDTEIDRLQVTKLDADGHPSMVDMSEFIYRVHYPKAGPLAMNVVRTEDEGVRREKLAVLHALLVESVTGLDPDDDVSLRFVTVSADPSRRGAEPLDIMLVASFDGEDPR